MSYKEPLSRTTTIGCSTAAEVTRSITCSTVNSISPTLTATGANSRIKVLYNNEVRMLNPLECWKLMGFKEEQYNKVKHLHSENELTKQAGNSICVSVLEQIFKRLFQ